MIAWTPIKHLKTREQITTRSRDLYTSIVYRSLLEGTREITQKFEQEHFSVAWTIKNSTKCQTRKKLSSHIKTDRFRNSFNESWKAQGKNPCIFNNKI